MVASLALPWSEESRDALGASLEHVIEVRANHPSFPEPMPLLIETGTIRYSEGQAPHVVADMELRVPLTQEEFDMLDPRSGVMIEIDAGYIVNGHRDVHRLANLYLWSRTTKRPNNTLALTARSMESRIIDWTPLGNSMSFTSANDAGQAISDLIHWALPDAVVQNELPPATFVTGADFLNIGTGDNVMRAIMDIADRAVDGWVYEDGLGLWHIKKRPSIAGLSSAIVKVGVNGTITASDTSLSLDEWYNAVLVEYGWYDGEQHKAQGWAEVTAGPLSVQNVGRRVLKVSRDYMGTTAAAQVAAGAIVHRTMSRGREMNLELATAPFWVRPGDTISVQLVTGPQERHLVTDIQFSLAATGTTNVTTRLPEDVTITTGE